MKLGFLTACMPERSLEEIAAWAAANGYEALELAAWPHLGDRPFTASHVKAEAFDEAEQERVRTTLDEHGLVVSALAYYDNNLSPDPAEREPRASPRVHRPLRPSAASRSGRSSGETRDEASPRTCARPNASFRPSSTTRASAACS